MLCRSTTPYFHFVWTVISIFWLWRTNFWATSQRRKCTWQHSNRITGRRSWILRWCIWTTWISGVTGFFCDNWYICTRTWLAFLTWYIKSSWSPWPTPKTFWYFTCICFLLGATRHLANIEKWPATALWASESSFYFSLKVILLLVNQIIIRESSAWGLRIIALWKWNE